MKYVGVAVSGLLAGLSGAVLVLDSAGRFSEGQTVGYGFIGIACMIVGNWRPWGVLTAALLFGFPLALRLRSEESVLALVLFITILSAVAVLWLLYRRRPGSSLAMFAVGLFFAWVYFVYGEVPQRLLGIAPYLLTLLVLALASQRLRMPAADGLRWRKGQTE
jgi:simple sugar transport system permease protein